MTRKGKHQKLQVTSSLGQLSPWCFDLLILTGKLLKEDEGAAKAARAAFKEVAALSLSNWGDAGMRIQKATPLDLSVTRDQCHC